MRTINFSVPESLSNKIDELLEREDYASRSELLRTALRIFLILEEKSDVPLLSSFVRRPLEEIKQGLASAGYKPEFIESVVEGLRKSSVYSGQIYGN